jgi:cytochrome P450
MSLQRCPVNQLYQPFSDEQLADPYPIYALARQQEPVFYTEGVLPDAGVYVLTRYDDILQVLSQPDLFLSKDVIRSVSTIYPESFAELRKGYPITQRIITADGDNHRRFRMPFNKAFDPPRIKLLEPFIRECASSLIDALVDIPHAEMISQFCYPLPLQVILHLFGMPKEDMVQARHWCDDWLAFMSAPLPRERQVECAKSVAKFLNYLGNLLAERRTNPRENDLVTEVTQHVEPGLEPLSEAEQVNLLASILIAGHETTTNLLGNGLRVLLDPRERWRAICEHPEQIPQTIEEILRYDSPIQTFFRTAARDAEIGGVTIPAGSLLLVVYGSANRDEAKFTNADQFNPQEQRGRKHLSFGHGKHSCVGALLARMEANIAFALLSQRFPNLRLASHQNFEHVKLLMHRGYHSLFVEW